MLPKFGEWVSGFFKRQPSSSPLAIELDSSGFSGTIRQGGPPGQRLPDLVAHRPEEWRFVRLANIVVAARRLAELELGASGAVLMIDAIESIADFKGDFTVCWRQDGYKKSYEPYLNRALAEEDEDEIVHELAES